MTAGSESPSKMSRKPTGSAAMVSHNGSRLPCQPESQPNRPKLTTRTASSKLATGVACVTERPRCASSDGMSGASTYSSA